MYNSKHKLIKIIIFLAIICIFNSCSPSLPDYSYLIRGNQQENVVVVSNFSLSINDLVTKKKINKKAPDDVFPILEAVQVFDGRRIIKPCMAIHYF